MGIGLVLLLWPRCRWCHSVLIEWQPVANTGGCVRAPALPAPMAPCCVLCPFPKHVPAIFGSLGLVAALAPSIPSREVWEIRLGTLIPPSGRLFPLYLAALAIRKKKLTSTPNVSHTNTIPNLDEVPVIRPFPSAFDLGMGRKSMPHVTEILNKSPLGLVPFPSELLWGPG